MQGSIERVRAVINGEMPDRAPLYDLLRNDAVISHFAGKALTIENAPEVVYSAFAPAVDATRPLVRLPEPERTEILADGRKQRFFRWTIWIEAVFSGDDIAFKSGPMLHPRWFTAHYFSRLARICAAYHDKGIKVLFHSDGNLNPILDGLVEAGIDGLNPIEVLADMNVANIHRRHPNLFMAGAIDVSQLLPFGSPQEVYDTVVRTIDAAEGRIMIGSSTELNNEVPLENYLALRRAVLEHPYR